MNASSSFAHSAAGSATRMSENLFGSTSVKKGLERFLGRLLAVEARLSEEGLTRGPSSAKARSFSA